MYVALLVNENLFDTEFPEEAAWTDYMLSKLTKKEAEAIEKATVPYLAIISENLNREYLHVRYYHTSEPSFITRPPKKREIEEVSRILLLRSKPPKLL